MIETTGLTETEGFVDGWLERYVRAVEGARFPISYHILCGMFALSSVVGRRSLLRRPGYRLYPPIWIMLLGQSGVGKGKSMDTARKYIIRPATHCLPAFLHSAPDTFTVRGLKNRMARIEKEFEQDWIEGAVTVDEGSSILKERTGNETIMQFLINASEFKDLEDDTDHKGHVVIKNPTLAFAMGSTLEFLRDSVSVNVFGSGFMHRFLIAHETRKPPTEEREVDVEALAVLAQQAREIREKAPKEVYLTRDAEDYLKETRNVVEEKGYPNTHLAGFWNRYDGLICKVGLTLHLASSTGAVDTIQRETLERADRVMKALYIPMANLVEELQHGPRKQHLFNLADSLYYAGPTGMSLKAFLKKLPSTTKGAQKEQLGWLEGMGLLYKGTFLGEEWVWRLGKWRDGEGGDL